MQIEWKINSKDVRRIQEFIKLQETNPFVRHRKKRNLGNCSPKITRPNVWRILIGCLLTTQQRSGPESNVSRFMKTNPFPLRYKVCRKERNLRDFSLKILSNFGGIRRTNRIANEIAANMNHLEEGLWTNLLTKLNQLQKKTSPALERKTANFIDEELQGFGPKQSRNFLQWLGLTRYEIPIDSRITKWLNEFGFPVMLNAAALGDRNYYHFVSDGIQQLCLASDIYPCILDAAIFASFDSNRWNKDNVGY